MFGAGGNFPPPDAPPGYLTRTTIEKVGGVGPGHPVGRDGLVDKPADEDEHAGHHGHAH
jgi:hypothetical protein